MKLRDYIIDLFRNFDGDKNTDFILKYPYVWENCFDIEEQSRYHRVMIDSVLAGFDACEAHYLQIIEKLESALKTNIAYIDSIWNLTKQVEIENICRQQKHFSQQALTELAEFKKKMNGEKNEN